MQELRDCITAAGDRAQFTVRASGQPKPAVSWYKEGAELEEGATCVVHNFSSVVNLD